MHKPRVIDIFCGVGGFSRGFEMAGFDITFGVDNWGIAMETFKKSHKHTKALKKNVEDLDDEDFNNFGNVDVVIAGPPCQGFSMSGKRDPHDIRNTLFEQVIRVVKKTTPKIVVMENVVGLLSMKGPQSRLVKDIICEKFEELGYSIKYEVLNAIHYGVPQARKRVIFIASRIGSIEFPPITHSEEKLITLDSNELKKIVTVGEAIGNIPDIGAEMYLEPQNKYQKMMATKKQIYNHDPIDHDESIVKRMSMVPQGGNWKDIPKEYYGVGGEHSNNYRRLHPQKPSVTLKHASKSMIIHPEFNRTLAVREVARLQSFDDAFVLEGTKSQQHQQLANAVPPLLGYAIAKHIKKYLEMNKMPLRFIDLFAGIGGFRIGLEELGCKCVFSSEIDRSASEAYKKYFGDMPYGDITKIDEYEIPDHEVLCAGFPCQPFSIAGHREGFDDTRGTLFFDVERILKAKKPKAFILENVQGILSHNKKNTIQVIRKSLRNIGYNTFECILDAKDFGMPQNRKRWFCVGFRRELGVTHFDFPIGVKREKTIYDILEKNVKGYEITEIAAKHIKTHYKRYAKTSNNLTIANEVRPSRCAMRDDGLVPCLTAKMGTGGNNVPIVVELGRKLTVNECLKLMGFKEDFHLTENTSQSYKQIGNSVAVPIISAIGKNLLEVIS
ncbi:MAG: DNA (cytosine-5-)-methyltransferase [Crenarchaeota archaeon]|nr:DNA (cytosine-5-)-methyltransferase [Thermoproteota archaeon]